MKLLDPDPLTWLTPDPGPKHCIIDYTLSFLPFFFLLYLNLFVHYVMRCAPPLEYAQILEQVDIQESLKSYNTASKILKEKVWCSSNSAVVQPAIANYYKLQKHTNLHYKKLWDYGFWYLLAIFGCVKVNAALACVRSYFIVLPFYQRSCFPPVVEIFVSIVDFASFSWNVFNLKFFVLVTINVPLILKMRKIIFFCGQITLWAISRNILRGPRLFWPLNCPSRAGFRIRIDLMRIRIRIQHYCGSGFRIRIPDPDPGFDDLKLEKIYSWKFNLDFFDQKFSICLSLGLHKGRPSYRRSLQPWKENIQHFKRWKFRTFFYFCG